MEKKELITSSLKLAAKLDDIWSDLEHSKERSYSVLKSSDADNLCQKLAVAQKLVQEALDILYDESPLKEAA